MTAPICQSLTANPASGASPLNPTLQCFSRPPYTDPRWTSINFRLDITYPNNTVIHLASPIGIFSTNLVPIGNYAAQCYIDGTFSGRPYTGLTDPVNCRVGLVVTQPRPTCRSLSVIDVATGQAPTATTPVPFNAQCTCTAGPEFSQA